jgi:hypothetical protein
MFHELVFLAFRYSNSNHLNPRLLGNRIGDVFLNVIPKVKEG